MRGVLQTHSFHFSKCIVSGNCEIVVAADGDHERWTKLCFAFFRDPLISYTLALGPGEADKLLWANVKILTVLVAFVLPSLKSDAVELKSDGQASAE